jgi:hypothetical protein
MTPDEELHEIELIQMTLNEMKRLHEVMEISYAAARSGGPPPTLEDGTSALDYVIRLPGREPQKLGSMTRTDLLEINAIHHDAIQRALSPFN